MSAEFWNKLKHNTAELDALKRSLDELSERVLALEAAKESPGVELDTDTLQPVKRGPGRPRKVTQ